MLTHPQSGVINAPAQVVVQFEAESNRMDKDGQEQEKESKLVLHPDNLLSIPVYFFFPSHSLTTTLSFNPQSAAPQFIHGLGQRPQLEVPLTPVVGREQ
jgi:hypothetical protein